MQTPRILRDRPFLKKFLISYLAILAIPMLLSFFLSRNSSQAVRNHIDKSYSVLMNQIAFVLDRRIRDMENLVLQIGQIRQLDALSRKSPPLPVDFTFQLNQAVKKISTAMMQENNLAHDYYIVFENSQYVIDDTAQVSFDNFFEYRFRFGSWHRANWVSYLRRYHKAAFLPADSFFNGSETYRAVPFIKTIPFYFNSEGSAHVIFMIKESDLLPYYTTETDSPTIPRLTRASDGKELLPYQEKVGQEYIHFSCPSGYYDLNYGISTPYSDVYRQFVTNRLILIIANIATFLMGSFAAIYFSRQNADPLHDISEKLPRLREEEAKHESPYAHLNRAVEQVISSNVSLETLLGEHKKIIGEEFYYRLVKYGFDSPDEMQTLSSYLDKELPRGIYGIILLNFYFESTAHNKKILEEFKTIKLTVMEMIRPVSRNPAYWMDLDNNSIGYIYSTPDREEYEEWCREAEDEIKRLNRILRNHGIKVFWTVGNPVREPYNLNASYIQARQIIEESSDEDKQKGIICYRNFTVEKEQYNLPVELIQKLILLGKSGNYELAEELFLENWAENIREKQISSHMLKLYLSDLRGLINRLDPEAVETADSSVLPLEEPSLMKRRVLEALSRVSRSALDNKKTIQDKLLESLYRYVEENYADPNLTLSVLSRKFNRSEGYLSHLFKQQGGENFYSILERSRLSRSMELLGDLSLSIGDVALHSGYSNVRTYRRAFKKIKGISPTEFREHKQD